MPKRRQVLAQLAGLATVVSALAIAPAAHAADGGAPSRDGGAKPAASASTAPGTSAAASASAPAAATGLPAGHPPMGGGDDNPHRGARGEGMPPGMFEPPEDTEQEDPTLPPGTVAVDVRDADDKPMPGEMVTLGILVNSVAKGDSRRHEQATSDAAGRVVFSGLELASNIAYRISVVHAGGQFAAMPFQLQQAKTMRVVLHVYPVTNDLAGALVVCEVAVAAEVRDDRIQMEEAVTVYNLGRVAWVPGDVEIPLPEGATAFNAQTSMSDQGADEVGGAARLHGTFGPGRGSVDYRFQVPWSGEKDVDMTVGMPPHVAIARVMMPASADIKLVAQGFPPAEVKRDQQGQTFLVSERHVRPEDSKLTSLALGIHDLPTLGPGRFYATLLAGAGVLLGLGLAFTARSRAPSATGGDPRARRDSLLAELEELTLARARGDVGPKTYERARRDLLDAIAETLLES
jgi:hypothetical protein